MLVNERYRLERLLGRGGMGEVYLAVDPAGTRYAVKLLLSQNARQAETRARFDREARVMRQVSSPHVATVLDHGLARELDAPYMVMELLDGEDLGAAIERHGPLPPIVAARIVRQACRGLAAIHARGIVHRDVKPANVFLHRTGKGDFIAKICDLGLAKIADESMTNTGALMGSPLFMSPEQIRDTKNVDAGADVWALGMTLFAALSGRPAFAAFHTMPELFAAVLSGAVPHVQDAAPWLEPRLARVLHTTLVLDRAHRCPSVEALASALAPFAGGTDQLEEGALRPVPDELRARVADRAELATSWAEIDDGALGETIDMGHGSYSGGILGGRYRIGRLLGTGGMGAVFEAEGPSGERVAVKVLSAVRGSDSEAQRRFVREVRASTSIHSPHVVRVIEADADASHGVPFYAMELLHGRDVERLVRDGGPVEPVAAAKIFIQAARGLAAAHARGVVHRDVKPANLFLHEPGDGSVIVKVCDFGIAKRSEAIDESTMDLTRTGGVLGSPLYMSPEQARSSKSVDARSDVFSLGVSLYEVLSGRRLWEGRTTIGELIVAICTETPPRLEQSAPWVDAALAGVVERALRRDPEERWPSAEAFARALESSVGSDATLRAEAIVPVAPELRATAPRGSIEAAVTGGAAAVSVSAPAPPSLRRWALPAIALVALTAGGAIALNGRRGVEPPTLAAPSSAPAPLVGRVAVSPPAARVRVNGHEAVNVAGAVVLSGEAGDRFVVEVSHEGRRQETTVTLGKDGSVAPASITLAPIALAPDASASAPAPPPASSSVAKPSKAAAPAAKADLPKAGKQPPSAAAPSGVVPKDDW